MDGSRRARPARRRHELGHGTGDEPGGGGEEEGLHQHRRGRGHADQRAVHAVHGALRIRHDGAREGHRLGGGEAGRQDVVLPDRRLCVRQGAREEHVGRREGERRPGARLRAASAVRVGLLVIPAAGAGVEGADPRPRERGRRHDQRDQGGEGIRHHEDDEAGGAADVHQRRAQPRTRHDAGPRADRQLVLEPRRRVAPVGAALLRQDAEDAVEPAGGRLFVGNDLPEGGAGSRHDGFRQGDGAAQEDEDRRLLREGLRPRRRQHDSRHVSDGSEEAVRIEGAVGLLQGARDDPGRTGVHDEAGVALRDVEVSAARRCARVMRAAAAGGAGRGGVAAARARARARRADRLCVQRISL
ncbi:protein of unknown function [Burkholderia multivorans]